MTEETESQGDAAENENALDGLSAKDFVEGLQSIFGENGPPAFADVSHSPYQPVPGGRLFEDVREFVEAHMKPTIASIVDPISGATALASLRGDGTVVSIPASIFDDYLEGPRRRFGTSTALTLDSLIGLVNRFKGDHSVLFASDDRAQPRLTAVLDYHAEGNEAVPGFLKHKVSHAFPLSDEWKAWNAANKKQMDMGEFAAFVEDRIVDVTESPALSELGEDTRKFVTALGGVTKIATPSRLMDLSMNLSVNENAAIKSNIKLSSGEGEVSFQTEHVDNDGKPVVIPTMLMIAIPVFKGGAPYQIVARLRYRVRGGVVFWYELSRLDKVFDHAFAEAATKAQAETGLPLFMGSPEA